MEVRPAARAALRLGLVTAVLHIGTLPLHAQATTYTVRDLGSWNDGFLGEALNESGQVAGHYPNGVPICPTCTVQGRQAAIWDKGLITSLGALPGDLQSFAHGLNGLPVR